MDNIISMVMEHDHLCYDDWGVLRCGNPEYHDDLRQVLLRLAEDHCKKASQSLEYVLQIVKYLQSDLYQE
jgi:hypothetical protein